jgi:hypothetical protein
MYKEILGDAMKSLLPNLTEWFPDQEERRELGESVIKDFKNNDYHLYKIMYETLGTALIWRTMVIGRKPKIAELAA